jgi:hypothetical protein
MNAVRNANDPRRPARGAVPAGHATHRRVPPRPEDSLRYLTSAGSAQPLPSWACYLVRLGRHVALNRVPGRRLVVGVTLPSRDFAAAFAALGVTAAVYQDPEEQDPRVNFERIAAMPRGTAIRFRRERFLCAGTLQGTKPINGVDHLQYYDGTSLCSLPWQKCNSVEVLDPSESFVRRRLLAPNADFVNGVLGVDPLSHASVTSLDCLLVGVKELLRADLLDEQFLARPHEGATSRGTLQDLLRCDAFEMNANDHDRTAVLASSADEVPKRLLQATPPVIVFDGPQGFIRTRNYWQQSAWIMLLDRTLPGASTGADAFNQERSLSLEDADFGALGAPPSAIEVHGYWETAR